MDNFEKLVALGAEVVAGSLTLDNVEVGTLTDGELRVNEVGRARLAAGDEPSATVERKTAAKKGGKKTQAPVEPVGSTESETDGGSPLDDLDEIM